MRWGKSTDGTRKHKVDYKVVSQRCRSNLPCAFLVDSFEPLDRLLFLKIAYDYVFFLAKFVKLVIEYLHQRI